MEIKIDVPDGKKGNWEVSSFTITEEQAKFENMRAMFSSSSRPIRPGNYKRLTRNGAVIMSNTPAEISDHMVFIRRCRNVGGRVLINGLGLGVALKAILESDKVESVDIVEVSKDVIDLVGPTYTQDPRVNIIHCDALQYKCPRNDYTSVWHDIWDEICADNLESMKMLHRKYGHKTQWQGSWARSLCERYR